MLDQEVKGRVFKVERFCLHDGPGIRTVVFMKGCHMRCRWCANPEGQNSETEWFFRRERCTECGHCRENGLGKERKLLEEDRAEMKRIPWQALKDTCPNGVFVPCGEDITAAQLADTVLRDMVFYGEEGGLTLSGGEVLCQAEFCAELLKLVKQFGCHTLIETCGLGRSEDMALLIEQVDAVYFDIKHTNSELHEAYTGHKTDQIHKNLHLADKAGIPITLRVPMIPGFNTNDSFILDLANLAAELKHLNQVHLLPYHEMGIRKYEWLCKDYSMRNISGLSNEDLRDYALLLEQKGIPVCVGGM